MSCDRKKFPEFPYWQIQPLKKMNDQQIVLDMLSISKQPFTGSALAYSLYPELFENWDYYTDSKSLEHTIEILIQTNKIKVVKSWWESKSNIAYCIPSFIDTPEWKKNYKNRGMFESLLTFCKDV